MSFFDNVAPVYDLGMSALGMYKHQLIIESLELKKSDVVLDLAGGTGFIASRIAPFVKKVVVADMSKKMLQKASRYSTIETCYTDAVKTPFDDNYFDALYCTDALHHIKRHNEAAAEIYRILKPNGRIAVIDFKTTGFFGKAIKWVEHTFVDDSVFISPTEIEQLFAAYNIIGSAKSISRMEFLFKGVKMEKNKK